MPLTDKGFPVMLTFDLDAETLWTARDAKSAEKPIVLSQGSYGWKVGIWRILELLKRYEIRSTFFVPGLVIEQRPKVIDAILEGGHELAHHSWSHRWILTLTPEEERDEMERGIEIIERVAGYKPSGYRSPAAEFSPITKNLLKEYGIGYSSNFYDEDSPYLHELEGERTNIVELPFAWVLDDAPFFLYSIVLPGRTMHPPSAVFEAWRDEFDILYGEDRQYVLAMHPQIIGRPSRIKLLERLIKHVRTHPGVWFARCDEVANAVRPILQGAKSKVSE